MTSRGANLQGIITFQLAWWGFVLGARDYNLNLLMVATALTAVAFILHYRISGLKPLLKVVAFASLGFGLDVVMSHFQVFQLASPAPLWLAGMWLIFVLSAQAYSEYFLPSRKMTLPLYAIGGPLTYWLCQRFGLVKFPDKLELSFVVMGVVWIIQAELWLRFLVSKPQPAK